METRRSWLRRLPVLRGRARPGPPARARHVEPLTIRQNWAGSAARWALRQGLVSLALTVAGLLSIVVAAFLVLAPLGFLVLGCSCIVLENLTKEERLR